MPTYGYVCENCGYEFERFQSITAGALRKCPKCGKVSLNRLIGAGAGVIFKGSGFYATDYRTEGYKKARESDKKTTTTTTKDTAKKEPETKPKEPKPVKKDKSNPTEKK